MAAEPPLTPRFVSNNPDDSEMIVSLAPLDGCPDDDNSREIRVSCPDATGLGCDLAREVTRRAAARWLRAGALFAISALRARRLARAPASMAPTHARPPRPRRRS